MATKAQTSRPKARVRTAFFSPPSAAPRSARPAERAGIAQSTTGIASTGRQPIATMHARQPATSMIQPASGFTISANRPMPDSASPSAKPRISLNAPLMTAVKEMEVAPMPATDKISQLK
jgi:hypothetical protein